MRNFIFIFLSFWFVGCQDGLDVNMNVASSDMMETRTKSPSTTLVATFPDGHNETFVITLVETSYGGTGKINVVLDNGYTFTCASILVTNPDSDLCAVSPSMNVCQQNQINVASGGNALHYSLYPSGLNGNTAQFVIEEMDGF